MAKDAKMKKSLIIIQTIKHTETIYTDNPKEEVNRLMQLYSNDVRSILLNDRLIYIKNEK